MDEVKDPTGAGDSFAGGFMGYIASQGEMNRESLKRAMFYGGVMGSFAVERFGTRPSAESLARGNRRALPDFPRTDTPGVNADQNERRKEARTVHLLILYSLILYPRVGQTPSSC